MREYTAFYAEYPVSDPPAWFRRTFILALAFAPWVAGIAGLFDRDCAFWIWSDEDGFTMARFPKRASHSTKTDLT